MLVVGGVFEEGIQIRNYDDKGDVVDLLTPKECLQLNRDISNALFKWSKLTRKRIDWESLK